jgi:hypothetical protein
MTWDAGGERQRDAALFMQQALTAGEWRNAADAKRAIEAAHVAFSARPNA